MSRRISVPSCLEAWAMHSRSLRLAGPALLALSLGAPAAASGCDSTRTELPAVVPLYGADLPDLIKDEYFVVMPDSLSSTEFARVEQQVEDLGGAELHRYETVLNGFLAHLP